MALAIPPPSTVAELPVTRLRFSVTAPPNILDAPLKSADPPMRLTFCRDNFPPGPSTSRTRAVPGPSIVARLPFAAIRVVITGSPSRAAREHAQAGKD